MKDFKVTKEGGLRGMELLNELSDATGLPDQMIGEELSRLISGAGKSTDEVTLDDLRDMLASYLQDVLIEVKDSFENDSDVHAEVQAAAAAIEGADKASATFAMFVDLGSTATDFIGEG